MPQLRLVKDQCASKAHSRGKCAVVVQRMVIDKVLQIQYTNKHGNQMEHRENEIIKRERGIDFEILAAYIRSGDVLEASISPNHPGQVIFMILVDDYVCVVPAVPVDDGYFLKTA